MTRRSRFGSARRLPSGRWQARYPEGGRLVPGPSTFATRREADEWLAAVQTDKRRGTWIDPRRAGVTLAAYAQGWLAERKVKGRPLAPRTRQDYKCLLDQAILPTLGQLELGEIMAAKVRTWHAGVLERHGRTKARQAYSLLRAVLNTALDDEAIARNPCRIRGAGQPDSAERPLLNRDQVEALADALPDQLRSFVLLMFWGHLRLGEALALRRCDLDLDSGTLRVERQVQELRGGRVETEPKAASRRTIHLPKPGLDVLREHLAERGAMLPTARVFVHRDGRELRPYHVRPQWQRARAQLGLDEAHLHDLRHAGLTLAAQSGATLAEVMRRAGHASSRAAMIYQHHAASRDAEIATRMGAQARDSGTRMAHRRGSGT